MESDLQKVIREAEEALEQVVGKTIGQVVEGVGMTPDPEDDIPDVPIEDAVGQKEPFGFKTVLNLIFGKSSPGDIISSIAGYVVAAAVGAITLYAPGVTGETTVTQLVGSVVALGIATLGRLIESNR